MGIGGITLGGGVGYLVRKYGLTIDDLLAADIVTADGQLRRMDAATHPDLFWAIRGGGNFGVVTRFQFRLHEVSTIVGGMLLLPATPDSIAGFVAAAEAAPEELSTIANIMPAPPLPFVPAEHHGKLVMMTLLTYAGAVEAGQRAIAPFRALATPIVDMVRPMRYPEVYPPDEAGYHPVALRNEKPSLLDRTHLHIRSDCGIICAHKRRPLVQGELMSTHTQPKPAGTPTWLELTVPDADAARAFYQAVFGWDYDISGPEFGGYATARIGQRSVAGISGPQPGAPPAPAAWSLYFASDAVEADVNRAVELGATLAYPVMQVGQFGSMAACTDPGGAGFSFWQADQHIGAQVTDEPGSAAWYELYAPNAKQARDFYTALLHATADQTPGELEYYVLKHGDDMIGGIMQIDPAWGGLEPQWVAYFAVADVEAAAAAVTTHGGTIMGPIDDSPFGRIAAVKDPSGAVFKMVEPPKGA